MASAITSSSTAISGLSFSRSGASADSKALQIYSLRLSDRTQVAILSQRRYSMKSLNAESQTRGKSWVSRASTLIASKKGRDLEDFEHIAKKLKDASPLDIMDKTLKKFRNDIPIAFK